MKPVGQIADVPVLQLQDASRRELRSRSRTVLCLQIKEDIAEVLQPLPLKHIHPYTSRGVDDFSLPVSQIKEDIAEVRRAVLQEHIHVRFAGFRSRRKSWKWLSLRFKRAVKNESLSVDSSVPLIK